MKIQTWIGKLPGEYQMNIAGYYSVLNNEESINKIESSSDICTHWNIQPYIDDELILF